jgi:hypothetical protein
MAAQTEVVDKVFDQAFEGFRKAAESTLHMQQDMFRQWTKFWPGFPTPQSEFTERIQKFQKDWAKTVSDVTRKFQESWDAHYKNGTKLLAEAFKAAETKDPEELRKKTEELWSKTFECLKGLAQAQVNDFQAASQKWIEMMTKVNG